MPWISAEDEEAARDGLGLADAAPIIRSALEQKRAREAQTRLSSIGQHVSTLLSSWDAPDRPPQSGVAAPLAPVVGAAPQPQEQPSGIQSLLSSLLSTWDDPSKPKAVAGPGTGLGTPVAMPSASGQPAPAAFRPGGGRADRFAAQIAQVAAEEGVPPDVLAGLIDTEDSGETSVSPAGARGIMQVVPGQGFDRPGEDASDPLTSIRQGARAVKEKFRMTGDWDEAGAAYFGYGTDATGMTTNVYRDRYVQNRRRYQQPGQAAQGPQPTTPVQAEQTPAAQAQGQYAAGSWTPNQINAATAEGLDYETALAVCGPAAAIAFSRKNGRNPSMQEAVSLAREVGWTPAAGMAGPASQQKLLERLGVASRLVDGTPDWKVVAADVQRGNPVTISTPGHYFVAERYDPESGAFDFGQSAAVLKASGGRTWFRPEELVNLGMGDARATLFIDNPNSPTPSVAVSMTATPPSPSGASVAAPSPAAAGASPPPAAAPPAPWDNETAQGGLMMKADGTEDFLPGDGGYAPQVPISTPFDPDSGPREATPGSVGSQPLPQTPNPMTYGPIQQGDVAEGPPTLGDVTMQNGGEPTANGPWTEMPVRPLEAQQPEPPQFSEASMPDIASGLKPVWDAAGQVIGYVQGAVSNVVQQAQSNMAQNRRNAEDANRATGYGQVSSTPGEPDYVPPTTSPLTWATNTLGEAISTFAPPAGGAPQQMDRMQAIEQQAAEWLGVDGSGMQGIAVRKRAVADPRWRAAQPALASEYDDLQRDFGLNVMGSVGDAAKFDAAARTAGRAASQGATRAAGQEAVNVAENMVPQSNAARVAAADARMAETGSTATGMAVGPTPGARGARQAPTEPWQMAPSEWQAEMARVSPDGAMPDPQVDNAAYRRWYELNANRPASETPTLQTAPFETDSRLRPAIESSYLRPDDYRFVGRIDVAPRSVLGAEAQTRVRAGLSTNSGGGVAPRAKFERDGRMTFQGEILDDPRAGRTMTHEVGHSIENNLPESLLERWKSEIHPPGNDAFAYGRHLQNGGEPPPTPYAGENWTEDFAETFAEWRQAQAEGRAPNLGPLRQRFMQDVDAWLSGGRSLERGTMDGQRFEQPRLLSTVGASPGGAGRDIWARAATDIGNALMGSMVGAVAPADSNEERLRNTVIGAAGFPLLGRGMRRAGGALGSFGPVPNGGRPIRQTVETLQGELDGMRSLIQRARQAGDADLEKRAIDRAWELESALVDARNARQALEPRISSDIGRRIETLPIDERTADDITGLGRERVSPDAAADLTQPSAVATDMRGRMNSALPFDPASAAMGGAAGAASEDENGDSGDPLRTLAGMGFAGVAGRMGRKPGHTVATGLNPGQRYEFRVRVVPLRDLITSHMDNLAVNRAFPGALQPRVRERAASRVQIDKMVQAFDPEQVLMDTHRVDSGPMIVGPDMVVESGNGRGIALRRLSQENPEAYANYVQALREELPYYGLTDDALQGIDQPVLVRERITPLDDAERARFATEANAPTAAQMSSMEQALADARSIGDGPLGRIVVGEDQTIDEALLAPENGSFVRSFMATVPDTERGKMLEANGNLSVTGLARVKAALLARTYPGAAGERVATAIVESTDVGLRNVQNAVMGSLPSMARVEGLVASGDVDGNLSLAGDVAAAVDVYARLKRGGILVGDYLQQSGMFGGRETTSLQDAILGYLNDNARAPRRLRALLEGYAREVEGVAGAAGDMFGGPATTATKEELVDGVLRRLGNAPGTDQGADLGRVGAGSNVVEGSGQRQQAVPPADTLAQAGRGAGSPSLIEDVAAAETLTPEQQIARLQAENDRLRAERRGGARRQQVPQPAPLQSANLPPVAADLIPSTGGAPASLQVQGAPAAPPAPLARPGPVGQIAPTGGPQATLQVQGAPQPMPQPGPIPQNILPTGGAPGTLVNPGAPTPLQPANLPPVGQFAAPPAANIPGVQQALSASQRRAAAMAARGVQPLSPLQWTRKFLGNVGYSSMIGIQTASVNLAGNVLEPPYATLKETTRAVLPRAMGGRGAPAEARVAFMGGLHGLTETGREVWDAIRARGNYASNPDQPKLSEQTINPIGYALALGTEAGGRLFSGVPDAFFGTIARHAGEAREAAQLATDAVRAGTLAKADWQKAVDMLLQDAGTIRAGQLPQMGLISQQVVDAGKKYADDQTFRTELGKYGKDAEKWARLMNAPVLGNLVTPLFTTPWNMGQRVRERTPIVGAVMNTQRGFDKVYDQIAGTALLAGGVTYAMNGRITGSGPDDAEKRKMMEQEGWRANSTLMPAPDGNQYYVPNRVFGIYASALNSIGEVHDALAYQKQDGSIVQDAQKRFGKIVKQEPYLQGVANILTALTDPQGGGLNQYIASNVTRMAPYASTVRAVSGSQDTVERDLERERDMPMGQDVLQRIRSGLGMRSEMPAKTDIKGQEIPNQQPGAWALLPKFSLAKDDPTISHLLENDADLSQPRRYWTVTVSGAASPDGARGSVKVDMPHQQQVDWQRYRWENLQMRLDALQSIPEYGQLNAAQKKQRLQQAIERANDYATRMTRSDLGGDEFNRLREDAMRTQRKAS